MSEKKARLERTRERVGHMTTDRASHIEVSSRRTLLSRRMQYRWAFIAANGKQLANGGEAYFNLSECLEGLCQVSRSKLSERDSGLVLVPDGAGLVIRVNLSASAGGQQAGPR